MGTMASPITSLTIVFLTVYSGADQRRHQSSASLAFCEGNSPVTVNSPHKGAVTRKMFPFDVVIMRYLTLISQKVQWSHGTCIIRLIDFRLLTIYTPNLAHAPRYVVSLVSSKAGTCFMAQRCLIIRSCINLDMMTSSNGHIFRVTVPKFTGHRWIPRTKASDAELWCFLWSAPWINGWVNNREAGDSRCHLAHYDVIVMEGARSVFRVLRFFRRLGSDKMVLKRLPGLFIVFAINVL